jgi:hypothetical protein
LAPDYKENQTTATSVTMIVTFVKGGGNERITARHRQTQA